MKTFGFLCLLIQLLATLQLASAAQLRYRHNEKQTDKMLVASRCQLIIANAFVRCGEDQHSCNKFCCAESCNSDGNCPNEVLQNMGFARFGVIVARE